MATDEIVLGRADVAPIDKFFFAGLAKKVPGLVPFPKAHLTSQELPLAYQVKNRDTYQQKLGSLKLL